MSATASASGWTKTPCRGFAYGPQWETSVSLVAYRLPQTPVAIAPK